eukprot:SAG31_NODE_5263_length_2644_cov_1.752849_1_plen_207_part_00
MSELNKWANQKLTAADSLANGLGVSLANRVGGGKLVVPADCMVACYPGDGKGYVRHVDNDCAGPDGLSVRGHFMHLRFSVVYTSLVVEACRGCAVVVGQDCHNNRVITAILYCNPNWQPDDGGCFRCWPSSGDHDCSVMQNASSIAAASQSEAINHHAPSAGASGALDFAPRGGRLLMFLSKVLPHEVLPAWANRYAISLWMLAPV